MTIRATFFVVVAASAVCAVQNAGGDELPDDAGETVAFLTKRIPAGTPLATAQRELESLGFSCGPGYGQSYPGATSVGTWLFCERELLSREATKRWQVAVVHEGGRVSSVHATYGVIRR